MNETNRPRRIGRSIGAVLAGFVVVEVDAATLDYRPAPKQRSMLELLQYMTIVGPIHLRAILAGAFDLNAWRSAWRTGEETAKTLNLDGVKDAIGKQSALFAELLGHCSDTDLRGEPREGAIAIEQHPLRGTACQ